MFKLVCTHSLTTFALVFHAHLLSLMPELHTVITLSVCYLKLALYFIEDELAYFLMRL